MTHIHVDWQGSFSNTTIREVQNKKQDYGVYQFYGTHPVYGSNSLLYIGRAVDQTFSEKIKQEDWDWSKEYAIYVGRLAGSVTPSDDLWSQQIKMVERLLIVAHQPAMNSSGLNITADEDMIDIHVFNGGDYHDLLPEVSGLRYSNKFDSIPNYKPYGTH